MILSRRNLLKTLAILPLAATLPSSNHTSAAEFRIIADSRLDGGRVLLQVAKIRGCSHADPDGELIQLLNTECTSWLEKDMPIIGFTSHSDYLLMADFARISGRRPEYAAIVGQTCRPLVHSPSQNTTRLLGLLPPACATHSGDGVAWIL